ncbi:MAG: hypothetical protein U1E57_04385 [Paenacidovorax caeni]
MCNRRFAQDVTTLVLPRMDGSEACRDAKLGRRDSQESSFAGHEGTCASEWGPEEEAVKPDARFFDIQLRSMKHAQKLDQMALARVDLFLESFAIVMHLYMVFTLKYEILTFVNDAVGFLFWILIIFPK